MELLLKAYDEVSSKRSIAAVKANQTRKARKEFYSKYPDTCHIAESILKGADTEDVVWMYDVSAGTVAAIKANLKRPGRYGDLANQCNF